MTSLYIAAFGFGALFILTSIIFGGSDSDFDKDIDVDLDHDIDHDIELHGGYDTELDAEAWLPFLSLRFWTFAFFSFGMSGTVLNFLNDGGSQTVTLIISVFLGLTLGYGISWTFQKLKKDSVTASTDAKSFELQEGTVELTIRPHSQGKIRLKIDNQIVEYITPEEQLNCVVAPSYEELWEFRKSHEYSYTHCCIPQAILGLPALTSPYANHNQAPRNVFQTNQVKQTCGWFSLMWYDRIEKNTFMQYRNEIPLIRTVANKYMLPNGNNIVVALMTYSGFNQEDSWIFNQGSLDAGLFMGEHFSLERAELENDNELFGVPPEGTTKERPRDHHYDKLRLLQPRVYHVLVLVASMESQS